MESLDARDNLLERKLLEKLTTTCEKIVKKNYHNPSVLGSVQIAALDFLGSVVMANSKVLVDKDTLADAPLSLKLDYVEHVRGLANAILDEVKKHIKSIELH